MSSVLPLVIGLAGGIYAFLLTFPKGRRWESIKRSFQRKPLASLVTGIVMLGILYAWTVGSHDLAAYLHDTNSPNRDQVKSARVLLATPVSVPLLLCFGWVWWHSRRDEKQVRRRSLHDAKLADPAKEYRVQAARNER